MKIKFDKPNISARVYYRFLGDLYHHPTAYYYEEQAIIVKAIADSIRKNNYTCSVSFNVDKQTIALSLRGVRYSINVEDIIFYNGVEVELNRFVYTKQVEELILTLLLLTDVYRGFRNKYTPDKGLTMFRYITDVFPNICTNFEPGFFLNNGLTPDCVIDLINWCNTKRLTMYAIKIFCREEFEILYSELGKSDYHYIGSRTENELISSVLEMILDPYSDIDYFSNSVNLLVSDKVTEVGKSLKEFYYLNSVVIR